MAKVWLITGSGNGLDGDSWRQLLSSAIAWWPERAGRRSWNRWWGQYGERVEKRRRWKYAIEAAARAAVQLAVDALDGWMCWSTMQVMVSLPHSEQMSADDFKAVVDTCFYGVVYTTRAAIPVMRKQKSGLRLSGVFGWWSPSDAGNTPYHAAKCAVGGFSDALAMEVAPLGVKICTLEPGGIRTNWARRARKDAPELLADYQTSVGFDAKAPEKYRRDVRKVIPRKIADLIVQWRTTTNFHSG